MNTIDLHCHTTASDGALSPLQLYQRAHERGIKTLAITDHDTVTACQFLSSTPLPEGPRLITGIELSTTWSGVEVHIVGLNFSLSHPDLGKIISQQNESRHQRSIHIATRLARRLNSDHSAGSILEAVTTLAKSAQNKTSDTFSLSDNSIQIGRPHFARWLKEEGQVKSEQDAFKKYLGNNKLGNLRAFWPVMSQGVAWIRALGGTAVLAHPGKYGMTRTKLKALIKDFKLAGGHALEVSGCNTPHSQTQQLASFCQEFELKASQGSDFHSPDNPWIELGRLPPLPAGLIPVWDDW